ncbi:hypothetical protein [Hymenobacter convexus]|uniref:hypothetical protein n=1 Tax=Hymenobacter sp. CA1UV-4 TaxID=3063782 RepID=UPI002713794A|nr:hypothetical protein [Hymenobacter sp. CA1UV-4]MDO7850771.1 hypothetical protein [Hymenobacter sp. CA1UV-4]
MRFFIAAALGSAALLTACHSASDSAPAAADPAVLIRNDFEGSAGWGEGGNTSITSAKAHDGRWSMHVAPELPFGYTFALPLGEISPQPIQKMMLHAWALRPEAGSTAQLVVQVENSKTDEGKVFYAKLPLDEEVPTVGEWKEFSVPLTLPTSAKGTNVLKLYLWNGAATAPTYLDGLTLRKAD